jgi:ribonuclease HI
VTLEVWTDGACHEGRGGWAWAALDGRWEQGWDSGTTNQRMELRAALEAAMTVAEERMVIVSDSAYVVNCFKDRWHEGWLRKGWKNYRGQPVANRDLWEPMIEIVEVLHVGFRKVRGHSGDPMNERVDQLAVQARKERVGVPPIVTP